MSTELFVTQIDGQTFLSQQEVDDYYEMLAQMEVDEWAPSETT